MDYTVIVTTPNRGSKYRNCATRTEAQNFIANFIRCNTEQEFTIEQVYNN